MRSWFTSGGLPAALACLFFAPPASAQDETPVEQAQAVDALSKKAAGLRRIIDMLDDDILVMEEEKAAELTALEAARAELSAAERRTEALRLEEGERADRLAKVEQRRVTLMVETEGALAVLAGKKSEIRQVDERLAAATTELETLGGEVAAAGETLAGLEADILAGQARVDELRKEAQEEAQGVEVPAGDLSALDRAQTDLSAAEHRLKTLRLEETRTTERLAELEQRRAALTADTEGALASLAGRKLETRRAEEKLAATTTEMETLGGEAAAAGETLAGLEADILAGQARVEKLRNEAKRRAAALADLEGAAVTLSGRLDAGETEIAELKSRRAALDSEIKAAEARIAELEEAASSLSGQTDSGAAEITRLDDRRAALTTEIESADATLAERHAKIELAETRLAALAAELSALRATMGVVRDSLAKLDPQRRSGQVAIDGLREEEDARRTAVARLDEEEAALREKINADTARLSDIAAKEAALRATVRKLEATRAAREKSAADLAAQIEAAKANLAGLKAAAKPAAIQPKPAAVRKVGGHARAATAVRTALGHAPGLGSATSGQLDELNGMLVDGACVTDALREVLGAINRHTLLSLIRDLDGC